MRSRYGGRPQGAERMWSEARRALLPVEGSSLNHEIDRLDERQRFLKNGRVEIALPPGRRHYFLYRFTASCHTVELAWASTFLAMGVSSR